MANATMADVDQHIVFTQTASNYVHPGDAA